MKTFGDIWTRYIVDPIVHMSFWDLLDILLLAVLLYCIYAFFRGRRAGKLAIGIGFVFFFYALSDMVGLRAIHRLLEGIAPYTILLLAIVFQPELRDGLEKIGSSPFGFLGTGREDRADTTHTISEVVDAACQIAMSEKDGALIVIERSTRLGEFIDKGQPIDSVVTSGLLRNIFTDRTPLHDGAVIISGNRIAVSGSKLPLSGNEKVVRGMGTRHRAAVGITEVSDCVVVVVSEERHQISVANNGLIKRDYNHSVEELQDEDGLKAVQNALRADLFRLLAGTDAEGEGGRRKWKIPKLDIRFRWKRRRASEQTLGDEDASGKNRAKKN